VLQSKAVGDAGKGELSTITAAVVFSTTNEKI